MARAAQECPALERACRLALSRVNYRVSRSEAKAFFEHLFTPCEVAHAGQQRGFVTGYFEPVLEGSRTRTDFFRFPLYRRPSDLMDVVSESERARAEVPFTHLRRTAFGLVPYATRAEIEGGALDGQGLELMWLADPVDVFFAHVQGSLRVRLPDGSRAALTYDGKNGRPYSSIGRLLIERGEMTAAEMTLERLGAWLRADDERGRRAMQHNASFVFFREADGSLSRHAQGALGTPLTPGRSLAVDTAHHRLGLPVFVDAPSLRAGRHAPFRRLMVAHDVGSAIRGPERGDIYVGSGDRAGAIAGATKHRARFFVLKPRERAT